jgi:biopolymer transport protein ExbB
MIRKRYALFLCCLVVSLLATAVVGVSQDEFSPEGTVEAAGGMTFAELFEAGGKLMYPIAAMSVIGCALVVYFLIVLRRSQVVPAAWLSQVTALLSRNRVREARELCDRKPSRLSAVASAALDYALIAKPPQPEIIKEIIEGEGSRQSNMIFNQVQFLQDIAVITPMLGLLGTVVGMLQSFNAIALDIAKAKPIVLAQGVSLALITTAAGLVVAIPAMIAYAYFRNRASSLVGHLEAVSAELLTLLTKEKDSELSKGIEV